MGQEGMLLVKGPNVMVGYLNQPEKTADAVKDGWYITGDVAKVDADGFITITDRLSRFSKIGGEMVPHFKVEDRIQSVLSIVDRQICAVVGVPDERKGERLMVLHTALDTPVEEVWRRLRDSDLPPLWVPARNCFFEIPELPVLGTGKLDLKGVKAMALDKVKVAGGD
ncbi:MAG: AMP-binding enzyme, partial [Planctomycetia bacterium]